MADGERAAQAIQERYPDALTGGGVFREQHWVQVRLDRLVEIASWLRDDPSMDYDYLVDVTAVHWPDDPQPVEVVYHLYSYTSGDRFRLKVRADDGEAVPTLSALWKSAEWNERETYDMFGIRFEGHPDLRRILMPDDYTDFPLRKEFPLYRG